MTFKQFFEKATSRKFLMAVGAVLGCILTAICGEPDNATEIVSICGVVLTAIGYIFGEASVDKAGVLAEAAKTVKEDNIESSDPVAIGFVVDDDDDEYYDEVVD